ncbi:xylulokinase [Sesbania bispinosa]|nr:xylulokinase [Sesbania bispinosa]
MTLCWLFTNENDIFQEPRLLDICKDKTIEIDLVHEGEKLNRDFEEEDGDLWLWLTMGTWMEDVVLNPS